MIIWKTGNIFNSECQTLVNTVNCKGVMGKGLALQFAKLYPDLLNEYKLACKQGLLNNGGDIWIWDNSDLFHNKKILCFATKEHWMYPSKLEWIETGLQLLTSKLNDKYVYEKLGIKSIAFPKLGCTNGKLNWNDVKELMIKYLANIPLKCEIYE